MADVPVTERHILVDVSHNENARKEAIEAVAEQSFEHRNYFSLLGNTPQIADHLSTVPFEAEFVETVDCNTPKDALHYAATAIRKGRGHMLATSQISADVSTALRDGDCLLPPLPAPALASIIPAVKSAQHDGRDRYCTILDIEGHPWPDPPTAQMLIALGRPLVEWFSQDGPIAVGVLTTGEGIALTAAQHRLLSAIHNLPVPFEPAGALDPADVMLGGANLVLTVGEGGAMFVRTLEATFVAAEALVERETQGVRGRLGMRIFRDRLAKLRDYGNIESYGGSPLLGVRAPTVVLRPEAGVRAWINAFRILAKMGDTDMIDQQRRWLNAVNEM